MSIEVIEGLPGAGKGCFAALRAFSYAARFAKDKRNERRIIANFEINHELVELGAWEEMQEAAGAICIMDEAQRWFNAREWSKNGETLSYFEGHRKDGLTLLLVCQSINQLDKQVRDLAHVVWNVRRMFGPDEHEQPTAFEKRWGWWAVAKKYRALNYGLATKQECIRKQRFRLDHWHGLFDTETMQGNRAGVGKRRGAGIVGRSADNDGRSASPARLSYFERQPVAKWVGQELTGTVDDALEVFTRSRKVVRGAA
jgi:hypothetical protein